MAKTITYRIQKITRRKKNETTTKEWYIVQRKMYFFFWKTYFEWIKDSSHTEGGYLTAYEYKTREEASDAITEWHNETYDTGYTNVCTVQTTDLQAPNW